MRTLTIRGRAVRVAVREGTAEWPPLLLCNGIGASLELYIYHGGHLELGADAARMAPIVEAFLTAGNGTGAADGEPYRLGRWTGAALGGLRGPGGSDDDAGY